MKKKLILFIILFYSLISKAQTFEQSLNSDKVQWKFYCLTPSPLERAGVRLGQKFPAKVPGTIHLDLLDNKLIPDPFYADNEKKLQWIDTLDWVYETTFDVDSNLFKQHNIELQFDGLDTYADVYLNDEKLFIYAKNSLSTTGDYIKGELKQKHNTLKIIFHSTSKESRKAKEVFEKKMGYSLPEGERVFVRKAQYQFGWDFAPRFLGCGILKGVKLTWWNNNDFQFVSCFTNTKSIIDDTLIVDFHFIVNCKVLQPLQFKILDKEKTNSNYSVHYSYYKDTMQSVHETLNDFIYQKKIIIDKKWRKNSFKLSNIIPFEILVASDSIHFFKYNASVSMKRIELVQQKDSMGSSFYFKQNGKPIFIKGANWVPADVFLPRVSHEKYRMLLIAAKDAGMNMLRVWGGGIYEDEYFYHLCDSLGLMVWQDLPFACSVYPWNNFFYDNVYFELLENYLRILRHPSVVIICGNNEIDEGWKNWGWQEQYHYSKKDSTEIWNNYKKLFEDIIPNTLKELGCDVPYISSSPKFGWGHKESLTDGDSHYWGVWWGMEPYEIYKKRVPRFASEYGMQSLPCLETIRKFAPDSSLRINSIAMRNHQKHPTGFENLDGYLKYYGFKVNGGLVKGRKVIPEYGKGNPDEVDSTDRFEGTQTLAQNVIGVQTPTAASKKSPSFVSSRNSNPTIKEFEDYINATQQLQADALRTAIEAHMKAQPRCMGTILWQLNEPWPGASWSLIDYYGNKKKAYYEVQKLFKEKK